MKRDNILKLIFSLTLPFLAGAIGSFFTTPAIDTWYAQLNKPSFNPPNWLFGPVWSILYIMMGIAFFIVVKKVGKNIFQSSAVRIFIAQLVLNSLWSIFFFGLESPAFALVVIAALWVLILTNIIKFYQINKVAGLLLIPYILWVSFASVLNFAIWRLN